MRIAVLGNGVIGTAVAGRLAKAGHAVVFGTREPAGEKTAAALAAAPGATAALPRDAVASAAAVLLAVPGTAALVVLTDVAAELAGKLVIDASNNFGAPVANALGEVASVAPDARRVRAFNSLGWESFADPQIGGEQVDLFYASDDSAEPDAAALLADVGVRPIRVGTIDQAGIVDALGRLWVQLAMRGGYGRKIALKLRQAG